MLSQHCNGSNSFLFVNAVKMYQFKVKDSEKTNIHCLGNISKDFYNFSVDYNAIDTNNVLDIYIYFMKKRI